MWTKFCKYRNSGGFYCPAPIPAICFESKLLWSVNFASFAFSTSSVPPAVWDVLWEHEDILFQVRRFRSGVGNYACTTRLKLCRSSQVNYNPCTTNPSLWPCLLMYVWSSMLIWNRAAGWKTRGELSLTNGGL